jgi:hypothetical protein
LSFPTAKLEQGTLESDRRIALGGWLLEEEQTDGSVSSVLGWEATSNDALDVFSNLFFVRLPET